MYFEAAPEAGVNLSAKLREREAAGRTVWAGTLEFAAYAPGPGVEARILGDLWHGSDRRRLGAARAARVLKTPRILEEVRTRIARELHAPVKVALEAVLV